MRAQISASEGSRCSGLAQSLAARVGRVNAVTRPRQFFKEKGWELIPLHDQLLLMVPKPQACASDVSVFGGSFATAPWNCAVSVEPASAVVDEFPLETTWAISSK